MWLFAKIMRFFLFYHLNHIHFYPIRVYMVVRFGLLQFYYRMLQLFLFHFEYAGARRNKISTLVRVMLRGFSSFLSVFRFVSSALSHMTVAASSEFPWMFECVCVCAVYLIFWNIRSLNKLLIRLGEEDKKKWQKRISANARIHNCDSTFVERKWKKAMTTSKCMARIKNDTKTRKYISHYRSHQPSRMTWLINWCIHFGAP